MISASVKHRIPFHDLDLMTVVWHGHYYKYFELARSALMQKVGLDWPVCKEHGYAMPIVETNAEYRQVLRYDEEITITAKCDDPLLPAMVINYEVTSQGGKVLHATGMTKQVYVEVPALRLSFTQPESFSEHLKKILPRLESPSS